MRRAPLILALFAIAAGLAALVIFRTREKPTWTTSSPEALQEFDKALDARMRLYTDEAAEHLRRAVELDPDFVGARVLYAETVHGREGRDKVLAPLAEMDLSDRSDRERFLAQIVELRLSQAKPVEIESAVERFVDEHPEDPWGVFMLAGLAWERRDWGRAQELYLRLLQVDPNWVLAHNNLGYLAMAQGRFAESEERFRTYAFVAPDQANPHDSLGELLVLLGRYDEARSEFETALAMRPDFCASYNNLLAIATMTGHSDELEPVLVRVEQNCAPEMAAELRCEAAILTAYVDEDFEAIWREPERFTCLPEGRPRGPLYHRMALLTGRDDEASAEEKAWAERAARAAKNGYGPGKQEISVVGNHVQGVRRLADGQPEEAAANFRSAESAAVYWGLAQGRMKLYNLLNLALALERAGEGDASKEALAQASAVNPAFTEVAYAALPERTPGPRSGS